MTTPKTFLCRCEDITLDECVAAIHDGFAHFEDLKRYLGVGTGPCQGKACVQACMQLIADERRVPLDDVDVMTFRPPVRPIAFATLAAPDAEPGQTADGADPSPLRGLRGIRGPAGEGASR
ncbi:MAG TPA: (2Fe-2S)-binding protein [Candidatus Thermoplasmatota archaeon]|nr:(2Fe-2S)-binding protein [Candidatus Thermoplasmatota archaeon]